MKKLFLLLAAATLVAACSKDAEEFDDTPFPVNGPTITVETPGTLAELLAQFDTEAITELIVRGNLNSDDFVALRKNLPNLAVLDMENVDLEELPYSAFDSKKSLTAVRLPKNLKTIGWAAFIRCEGLTSVVIPKSVTTIRKLAFEDCSGLTGELVIPKGVTTIEERTFAGCSGLTEVVIPEGVTSIGDRAFAKCSGLTKVVIPEGVTTIGESAFSNCRGLTSVTFPQSMWHIDTSAFWGCKNLAAIYCKATVPPRFFATLGNKINTFNYAATTLYIPVGTAEAYKAALYWRKFDNIVEMKF